MSTPPENLRLFPDPDDSSPADSYRFEGLARRSGYRLIAGVDEAGRGPLAGPVVAAAVILPPDCDLERVRDSKQMTAEAREEAFGLIQGRAVCTGIGVVSRRYIDEHDILRATLEAMRRAVSALDPPPDFLLVDGITAPPLSIPQRCLKKGDQRSRSISAASVLAKVYRDRIMSACHHRYPVYGFANNKGYGTRQHLDALKRYGPCPFHRLTFRGVPRVDQSEA